MNGELLSLNQAAKAVGKSPSTISKYLNKGKISYVSKDEAGYKIEPSELYRVFPKKPLENIRENDNWTIENRHKNSSEYIELQAEVKILNERETLKEREIEILRQQVEDLQSERNDWKKQAQTLLLQHTPEKRPQEPLKARKKVLGIF